MFKDAFGQLDLNMQRQIKVFMSGGSDEEVLAAGAQNNAFALPPSPPVKHHFQGLAERVEGLFHLGKKANDGVASGTTSGIGKQVVATLSGYPQIFENEEKTKTMEVASSFSLLYFLIHQSNSLSSQTSPKYSQSSQSIERIDDLAEFGTD